MVAGLDAPGPWAWPKPPGSTPQQRLFPAAAFPRHVLSGFLIVLLCLPGPAPATPLSASVLVTSGSALPHAAASELKHRLIDRQMTRVHVNRRVDQEVVLPINAIYITQYVPASGLARQLLHPDDQHWPLPQVNHGGAAPGAGLWQNARPAGGTTLRGESGAERFPLRVDQPITSCRVRFLGVSPVYDHERRVMFVHCRLG